MCLFLTRVPTGRTRSGGRYPPRNKPHLECGGFKLPFVSGAPQEVPPFVLLLIGLEPNLKGYEKRSRGFESETPGWNPFFWQRHPRPAYPSSLPLSDWKEYRVLDSNRRYPPYARPDLDARRKRTWLLIPCGKPIRFAFHF